MNQCQNCSQSTNNPKFCSTKCSAIFHNKPQGYKCKTCGILISLKWTPKKECDNCKTIRKNSYHINLTLKELKIKMPNINQFHAKIRGLARSHFKSTGKCSQCGYDKHTNVCHIKSVNKFNENTPISEINSISNLIELCPNCHWEFDHK